MIEYPYVDEGLIYFNEETIIVDEDVEVRWHGKTKTHYLDKGYKFTKHHDYFTVDVRHLTKGSTAKVIGVCPICQRKRKLPFNDLMRQQRSMCSGCRRMKKLTGKVFNRLSVIKQNGMNSTGNYTWLCKCECGNIITVTGGNLISNGTKSCGCLRNELASKRCGENHPSWRHDMTIEEREHTRDGDDFQWAKDVKELVDYTCQCCNHRGGSLVSHHLNNYSNYYEQRHELGNGVTLCETCHKEFHSWMGGNQVECTTDDLIDYCEVEYPNALFLENI